MYTKEVIEHFGGPEFNEDGSKNEHRLRKTAYALGLSTQAIYLWGDIVPEKTAYRIETITNGKLKVMGSDYESTGKDS